jgi:hypothetical protein
MTDNRTAGQKMAAEITALIKARAPLLWVVSPEETRTERGIIDAATAIRGMNVRLWDCVSGVTDGAGADVEIDRQPGRNFKDCGQVLAAITASKERAVWVLRDLHKWFQLPDIPRALRNLAHTLSSSPLAQQRAVIILTPSGDVPPDLANDAIVVRWPMPDRAEIGVLLDRVVEGAPEPLATELRLSMMDGGRDAAVEAALGLTAEGAAICYTKSLVTSRRIVPADVAAEKKRVINQSRGIEWSDPDPRGLDAVGGLDLLKPWLLSRAVGFSQEARDFGLPSPKGMLLVGVPGCGKSLTAKATAAAFQCPLLRLDMGAAQSKWVGESQQNIRGALAVAETVGKCVLWIDEIEKALAGATSGAADGGVSADALGTLLSWMQERKGSVFVIATANDVTKLPPELLRKGRWDDLFFVDLPTSRERLEILRVAVKKYGRDPGAVLASPAEQDLVESTADFTGAEIEALIEPALYAAFADGKRDLRIDDLMKAARETTPLARTAQEKVEALRNWAKGRARPASLPEEKRAASTVRVLDLSDDSSS